MEKELVARINDKRMDKPLPHIGELLVKHLNGSASETESEIVNEWLESSAENRALYNSIKSTPSLKEKLDLFNSIDAAAGWRRVKATINVETRLASPPQTATEEALDTSSQVPLAPVHRIRLLKMAWFRYAAAIIIALGLGTVAYHRTTNKKNDQTLVGAGMRLPADVAPGGEKAVLTLADGSKIILDSAANGNLAHQGDVQVIKASNGQVIYEAKSLSGKEVLWNTMSTPAGGQYQVILPDGTRVWLNAASSITYPTSFAGNSREVKISGEVYLEVTKNARQPFIVDINGHSKVQVLGTSFNINSYADEGNIKTTLLEGSVKVFGPAASSVVLKPGDQAIVGSPDQQPKVIAADLVQTLAWKNGVFDFNGLDVSSAMKQLARWYDINIRYEGDIPHNIFRGEMYRNENLSVVLGWLQDVGIKCKIEGKTLIVTGSEQKP